MKLLTILLFTACMVSCTDRSIGEGGYLAYVPVYLQKDQVNDIRMVGVTPTSKAGKIYAYGQYIFQVEQGVGIHFIDNSNPQQPHKIGFLKVPVCTELSIKGGFLYTNNLNDLVVFDISSILSPQLVKRLPDAFPAIDQQYPPMQNVYFECPDPSKGMVVGWEERSVSQVKCRR
jgi:hypothetical protein